MSLFSPKPGFTLAELLIALALLGVIAAFTIPKVLQSSAENERVAKLRETVATLEQIWYNIKATNPGFAPTSFLYDIVVPQLNAVSTSVAQAGAANQVYAGLIAHPCYFTVGYAVLPNGVVVSNLRGDALIFYSASELMVPQQLNNTFLCIDLNGAALPNEAGQDVFAGDFNPWGDFDYTAGAVYTYSASSKSFHWGNNTSPVYDSDGLPLISPLDTPESRVGTWLTR